jgi:uncharacterized protein
LSQQVLGHHLGRFCLDSGVNFNRSWYDCTEEVAREVGSKLTSDARENVKIIREELLRQIESKTAIDEDVVLKKALLQLSCVSDIVLDLHCDCEAVLHLYTHDRLWPKLSDFAEELGSRCQLLDSNSGGNCFDEANCNLWSNLADRFPSHPIPMACEACTVELRGEADVSHRRRLSCLPHSPPLLFLPSFRSTMTWPSETPRPSIGFSKDEASWAAPPRPLPQPTPPLLRL